MRLVEKISNLAHSISSKGQNNYIILFLRKVAGFILCNELTGNLIAFFYKNQIPNGNCIIDTDCPTVTGATKARIFWGIYETPEIAFVKKYLNPELDVIELGSSIGVLASHVGKKINSSCKLICVEANPILLKTLQKNLELNITKPNVNIVHAAIDYVYEQNWVEFTISNNSLDSGIKDIKLQKEKIKVATTTLSNIISKYGIDNYTLICDIEGAEYDLFMNENEVLKNCKQLHLEMQENEIVRGKTIRIKEVVQMLQDKYDLKPIDNYLGAYVFEK